MSEWVSANLCPSIRLAHAVLLRDVQHAPAELEASRTAELCGESSVAWMSWVKNKEASGLGLKGASSGEGVKQVARFKRTNTEWTWT